MADRWIAPDALFDGAHVHPGTGLRLSGGVVAEVGPPPANARRIAGTVTPGYVDLQVNGGGGILLNQTPTADGMARIAAAHRTLGTVAILPTVITDAPDILPRVAHAALAARGAEGIAGLHIEGPHISVTRRGTHAERYVRPLDETTIRIVADLRGAGIPVMITVAPEAVAPGQIATLAATGAVVSLGHTDTDAATVRATLAEGARCFTHLFNAMSPMQNRAPGVTGAAINSDAFAGIICDGVHVDDTMVALAIRARPVPDRMFLVSDAMPTVAGPDRFDLYGAELRLRDGRLVNDEGSLAGAHVSMGESVARLVNVLGIAPEMALRMAVTVPAALMGLPHLATLAGRAARDVLTLDDGHAVTGTLADLN